MEHSRIILGEKVYKELNPTSKEKSIPPTVGRQPAVAPFYSYFSLISLFYLYIFYTPFYTPSLGLDWLSDSAAITDHIQPSLCVKRS